jgi:hypothetical protein
VIDGRVDVRQAMVIADALPAIPAHLDAVPAADALEPASDTPDRPTVTAAAEATLIEVAARFPAYQPRRLGERILAHVAPQIAERADEAVRQRQELQAGQARSFNLSRLIGGVVRLTGLPDTESAAIVEAALQPLCRPAPGRRPDTTAAARRRPDRHLPLGAAHRRASRLRRRTSTAGSDSRLRAAHPEGPRRSVAGLR